MVWPKLKRLCPITWLILTEKLIAIKKYSQIREYFFVINNSLNVFCLFAFCRKNERDQHVDTVDKTTQTADNCSTTANATLFM